MNQETTLYNLNLKAIDLGGILKCVINFFFHHNYYSLLKRNKELYMKEHEKKKCYVCALGPSLKNVDLNKIKGDTIVVNRFFKIGLLYPNFVPTYYIMLDHLFNKPENISDFEKALESYIHKGTIFILNSKLAGLSIMKKYSENKNIYYISCFRGSMHPYGKYALDKVMPAFQNVVGAAILIIALMGYKKISLLGCDFNSFASTQKIHCYKDRNTKRNDKLSFELFCYYLAARNHDDLYEYARINGIEITNSTEGSLIDSYPIEIEEELYFK